MVTEEQWLRVAERDRPHLTKRQMRSHWQHRPISSIMDEILCASLVADRIVSLKGTASCMEAAISAYETNGLRMLRAAMF